VLEPLLPEGAATEMGQETMLRQALAPGTEAICSDLEVSGLAPDFLVLLRMPELCLPLLR
jgi:hypothetical protein